MAFLTVTEWARVLPMRPEIRGWVEPVMQATEDTIGKKLVVTSGIRTYAQQAKLVAKRDAAVARGEPAYAVAPAGQSKHEYGSAFDLSILGGNASDYAALAAVVRGTGALNSGADFVSVPKDPGHVESNEPLSVCMDAWNAVESSRLTLFWGTLISSAGVYGVSRYLEHQRRQ